MVLDGQMWTNTMNDAAKVSRPTAIGTPEYVYGFVLRLLREFGVRRVLDCPAGHGAFTARLVDSGFEVQASDILPENFELHGQVECKFADLNDSMPYDSGSFSAIVCLNGLHRVWARGRALSEFARVLSPGGYLILTNVNNANLTHRLMALACGSTNYNTHGPPFGFLPTAPNPAAVFRYPQTIADVLQVAEDCELRLNRLTAIRWSRSSTALAPVAAVSWALAMCLPKRVRARVNISESNSVPSLFGDYLAIVLKKRG